MKTITRIFFISVLVVFCVAAVPAGSSQAASGYAAQLTRYPYLTDVVGSHATVNFATDNTITGANVTYGPASGGNCAVSSVSAAKAFNFNVYPGGDVTASPIQEFQWRAELTGLSPNTRYCYRVQATSPAVDLLGSTTTSPSFWSQLPAGATDSYSFIIFGDWGYVDPSGGNPHQANLLKLMAQQNARFAITVGDNVYATTAITSTPSQTQYGDLYQTGVSTSAVFGPNFWTVAGATLPIFPAVGNHGFAGTHLDNWSENQAVAQSNGTYAMHSYPASATSAAASYPDAWYAFTAGVVRFYILESTWADSNGGTANLYVNDYNFHWQPGSPQYDWLKSDLAAHPGEIKIALYHFPMYADSNQEGQSDTYLQTTGPAGANSLESLFKTYGVKLGFSGHGHFYERNKPTGNGLITYVLGTGGGELTPVGLGGGNCASFDAYSMGWSTTSNTGNACGAAAKPTQIEQVYSFALVTVDPAKSTVKIAPMNELGNPFDVQTYTIPFGGIPVTGDNQVYIPLVMR